MTIKKVAVLGSGVMGSGIAAHLANAGIPSLLLDIVPPELTDDDKKAGLSKTDPRFRNKLAARAINEGLATQKPSPIFEKRVLKLITPGNFEDDMAKIADCDWVVEVVVERLDIKQKVFAQIEKHLKPGTMVTSNTSGIPLAAMAEGRSPNFRKNFFITHFFNPVRYMKLVEIVSGPETDPAKVSEMADFLENVLGKGVVYAKDTPCFIANRIGVFGFMGVIHHTLKSGLSVEAVDKITGPAIGKPKSATFRTADIVGLDTLIHLANNTYASLPNDPDRDVLKVPPVMQKMLENKWLGDKVKQGFYKKTKTSEGKKEILSLDLKTLEYRTQEKVRHESLGVAKNIEETGERIKAMVNADDEAGRFAWTIVRDGLVYTASRIPEIADDVVNVDNAMRWGFNWDLGPFEVLDAIGVKDFAERVKKDGVKVPALLETVLASGATSFYKTEKGRRFYFDLGSKSFKPVPVKKTNILLNQLKEEGRVLKENTGASLIDLGDGVVNVEFHTKMNALDQDIIEMLSAAIDLVENDKNYKGIVIANEAQNFSVGANLMLMWMEAQNKNWEGINLVVKAFQDVGMRLKYCKKPVVAAPSGMALGGGCETVMTSGFVRAHGETYIGLVELGAGLIPAGGGCKNLILNAEELLKEKGPTGWFGKTDGGPMVKVNKCFETIGFAKVATSALEGVACGYIPKAKFRLTLSRDCLVFDAKQDVLELSKNWNPGKPREDILMAGQGGMTALFAAIENFQLQGKISEHDAVIARALSKILAAGHLPNMGYVSEQDLLDLEREAFLSLIALEKTQARMQALVMTGKPLRN